MHVKKYVTTINEASKRKGPTGILMMNMGGPQTLNQVHSFLKNLFSDSDLIQLPFQKLLGPLIAKRRTPKIQEQYSKIGGGSPIKSWTEKQGHLLCNLLDRINPDFAPHKYYLGFRYADPSTENAIIKMKKDAITNAVAFSQYPQYSCSTTGSSLNHLYRTIKNLDNEESIKWSIIDRWSTHKGLVSAFVQRIQTGLKSYPRNIREDVILLFSAHSLPMASVYRGDTYPSEVAATVSKVMESFKNPHYLVWQSQVGPSAWLGPQTHKVIEGLGQKGHKNMLLIPIAFTTDHIETLYELDLEYGHLAKQNGIIGFKRVESLNDSPIFIDAMADLVKTHLNNQRTVSPQYMLRCPDCTNLFLLSN